MFSPRYRLVAALLALALLGSAPARAEDSKPLRVAILPLDTPRDQPDLEQYGAGTMDTLITALANVPNLMMIDRGRIEAILKEQQFAATGLVDAKSAVAIGHIMGAQILVSGSVGKVGDKLHIVTRFTDADSGEERGNEEVTGALDDIFDLMDQLAHKVAAGAGVRLTQQQQQRLEKSVKSTTNRAAYDLYLQGRKAQLLGSPAGYAEAVKQFRQAIAADPKYALAYAGLADTLGLWGRQRRSNGESYREQFEQAYAAAGQALAINPDLAEAHRAHGAASRYLGKPGHEAEVRQALAINPNDAEAWYELWLSAGHENDPDHESITKALALNPDLKVARYDRARALRKASRLPEALAEYQQALRTNPNDDASHYGLGRVYLAMKQPVDAIKELRAALTINPRLADAHFFLGEALASQGKLPEAAKAYQAALAINPSYKGAAQALAKLRGK